MALVDLRGRESEPEVRALLEPDGAWNLVGWSRDETLVACAGMERVDADEVAVRALAARDDHGATSLPHAIVGVAPASRLSPTPTRRVRPLFAQPASPPIRNADASCAWSTSVPHRWITRAPRRCTRSRRRSGRHGAARRRTIPTNGRRRTARAASARSLRS